MPFRGKVFRSWKVYFKMRNRIKWLLQMRVPFLSADQFGQTIDV